MGIRATSLAVPKDVFNAMVSAGNFSAVLTESWGAPYDPHSFASSWRTLNEGDGIAQAGMQQPTKAEFDALIDAVLGTAFVSTNPNVERQRVARLWREILLSLNNNSVYAPLSYTRNFVATQSAVKNLLPGFQQFDFPLDAMYCEQFPPGSRTPTPTTPTTMTMTTVPVPAPRDGLSSGTVAAIVVVAIFALLCIIIVAALIHRERVGRPIFKPLVETTVSSELSNYGTVK